MRTNEGNDRAHHVGMQPRQSSLVALLSAMAWRDAQSSRRKRGLVQAVASHRDEEVTADVGQDRAINPGTIRLLYARARHGIGANMVHGLNCDPTCPLATEKRNGS